MPRELAPVESIFNWSANWGSTERTRKSFQVKYFVQAAVVGVLPPPDPSSVEYAKWSTTRLAFSAALLERAFTRLGWASAYVGGGVLQFHLGGEGYQTGDLDLVVAQTTGLPVPRRLLDDVMRQLGARPGSARHWMFGVAPVEILVEIPNHDIPLDADRIMLPGGFVLGSARLS